MSWEIVIVIVLVLLLSLALYREWLRPVVAFLIVATIFLLCGIISPLQAIGGFANEQIVVIALLLVLSEIVRRMGALDLIFKRLFSRELSYKGFLVRMMAGVSGISAFVNNTPLVAILLPYVYEWGKRKKIYPSKLLLPLSYAAMLGGTITLVGTSTNLMVNGMAVQAGLRPLELFEFSYIGLPLTIAGLAYLYFIGRHLLPSRQDAASIFAEKSREYLVETAVPSRSSLIGKTVEQANLRSLRGLFLVQIIRNDHMISPVSPSEIIREGDILIFAGATDTIVDLIRQTGDLLLPEHSYLAGKEVYNIFEVVVSSQSSLVGKKIRDTNFRGIYDAAIVAVQRNGEKVSGKIGELELQSGDLLLLVTGSDFRHRAREEQDFYLISRVHEGQQVSLWKNLLLIGGFTATFVLSALHVISLMVGLLALLCLVAGLKVVRLRDIEKSVSIDLIVILALSLGIGQAVTNSGADVFFADALIRSVSVFNSPLAVLAGIYLLTNILAMFLTNKSAVVVTFPIALAAVNRIGLSDPTPFVLAVALAGSAEFITPFGYQTNLMVFGPGSYRFRDFVRVGLPLTMLYMVVTLSILGALYNLF